MSERMELKRVIRLDSVPMDSTYYTDEGYLCDEPILTSTGIFEYMNPDGTTRRELRLPEEVFDRDSLASYKGKPIIITHDAGLIDENNVGEESIGTILSDGYKSGNDVRAEIIIHDTGKMRQSRLKELSLGYKLDLEETPGVWRGQPYDAIQRNIRVNHLALVREARAGDQARLNIDSKDGKNILIGGRKMAKTPTRKSARHDGILSPEELEKAITEYLSSKGDEEAAAADDEDTPMMKNPETPKEAKAPKEAPKDAKANVAPKKEAEEISIEESDAEDEESIEDKIEQIKARNGEDKTEPKTLADADDAVKQKSMDVKTLMDIIDTLLAERDYKKDSDDDKKNCRALDDDEELDIELNGDEDEPEFDLEKNEDDDEDVDVNFEEDDDEDLEEEIAAEPKKITVNADSVDKLVRQRVKLGMIGRTINLDGLEDMPLKKAKKEVIKKVRPSMNLDGKSGAYINAAFDLACEEIQKGQRKGTKYQAKQMFNADGRKSNIELEGAEAARARMIERMQRKEDDNK